MLIQTDNENGFRCQFRFDNLKTGNHTRLGCGEETVEIKGDLTGPLISKENWDIITFFPSFTHHASSIQKPVSSSQIISETPPPYLRWTP